ncbi:glycoside hydrolase family 31 protein [Aspergillus novofumigatus IBT 16806]|uniref:alpha-glucosidase n=1 Tax=Aspergillus novofumigatus (strain IBT 16806) TaxID=1392255 RepID=A0A2I1CB64_ASPN1|nr:alpha-glucosidase [Aspergillus novofumigatus IBT 16806]PKX94863.1 alpha-glucosidase [Aspergillus novofumigatus IBT 16806]
MVGLSKHMCSLWLVTVAHCLSLPTATKSSASSQYTIPSSASNGQNVLANIEDPKAVDAQGVCPGYKASDVRQTRSGLTATLELAGKPCNVYGTDLDRLTFTVEYQAPDRVNVQITPANIDTSNSSWYILPESLVAKPKAAGGMSLGSSDLEIAWSNDPTFNFKVTRKANGDVLFNTEGSVLVFEDQFLEFKSSLPDDYNLYGLGEHITSFRLHNNLTLTTYAADIGDPFNTNLYGAHPFYLETRYYEIGSGNRTYTPVSSNTTDRSKKYTSFSHGVYLRNAHGQEVKLLPDSLTWRAIGGSIDLYFYAGPSQTAVTQNYQVSTIGLPAMQQYFTLGYHQSRWGYRNWAELEDVVDNFEKFKIPLETIWTDIDYMNQYRNFENDQNTFGYKEGRKFLNKLHKSGRHYVPILDTGIYVPNPENASDAYDTYTRGTADDAWLKNPDGSLYIGSVWPGYTVFTDFHHPKAVDFWANELVKYHEKVAFDGIWMDMNEASSFCVGSCGSNLIIHNPAHPPFKLPGDPGYRLFDYPEGFNVTNSTEAASASAAASSQDAANSATQDPVTSTAITYLRTTPTPGARNINYPPYAINNVQSGHDLAAHALSPNATHIDGTLEYDVHNLYGHQVINATYQGLLAISPNKRPFIIGRSTFAGSGQWAGHWGGDNYAKWAYMYSSIPHALSFSLYGIPMFGVDTCGFDGNTDEELCNRWMQLSAFFPFYRNHNRLAAIPQEPYRWASVIKASQDAMKIRYSILPYMYTLMYQAHATGSTVMRALAWEFPDDPALAAVETQFLLGPALMIIPVLVPQANAVKGVFPGLAHGEKWYDWYTQREVDYAQPGKNTTIPAPLGHIPVFVRGGHVIPMQEPALTTREARNTSWSLLVALDDKGDAAGQLYLDDGESISPEETLTVNLVASSGTKLVASVAGCWKERNNMHKVTVLGVKKAPSQIRFNGRKVKSAEYNATSQVLSIHGLEEMTRKGAWEKGWVLAW